MYSSTFYPIEAVGESRCEGLFRRYVWDTECEAMTLSKTFKTKCRTTIFHELLSTTLSISN
jgi:hypothetical protein